MENITILHDGGVICNNNQNVRCSKKSKRRSKPFKSKLQKNKSPEQTDSLNPKTSLENITNLQDTNSENATAEKLPNEEPKTGNDIFLHDEIENENIFKPRGSKFKIYVNPNAEASNETPEEDECVLVNAIKHYILKGDLKNCDNTYKTANYKRTLGRSTTDWKNVVENLPFNNNNLTNLELLTDPESSGPKLYSQLFIKKADMQVKLMATIKYLSSVVEKIIEQYNMQWKIDGELEHQAFHGNYTGN